MKPFNTLLSAVIRLYPARVRREHGTEMLEIARHGSAVRAACDLLRGLLAAHLYEALASPEPAPLRLTIRRHGAVHAALHALMILGFLLARWRNIGDWPHNSLAYPCSPGLLRDAWDAPLRLYRMPICSFQDSMNMYFEGPSAFISAAAFIAVWTAVTFTFHLALRRIRTRRA